MLRVIRNKLLLSILLLAAIIASAVVLQQEVLRVHAVVVRGCVERPPEEVTALSGIAMDESIFSIDPEQVQLGVEASPYYEVASVERAYPDRVVIQVRERRQRAIAEYLGASIVMDEEGYILEVRQEKGSVRCPVVTGLQILTFTVGQRLDSTEPTQLHVMGEVLGALEQQGMTQMIAEIALENPIDVRMTTVEGYTIALGDVEELDYKFTMLQTVLPELRTQGEVGGTIYLLANGKGASYKAPGASGEDAQAMDVWGGAVPDEPGQDADEPSGDEPDAPTDGDADAPVDADGQEPSDDLDGAE